MPARDRAADALRRLIGGAAEHFYDARIRTSFELPKAHVVVAIGANRYPAARRAAEARALRANWDVKPTGPALSTPFAGYLYVATAELLLVTTSADLPFAIRLVDQATREARSDALVVSFTGRHEAGPVRLALGLWSSAGTRWTAPAQPWLGNDGTLWLGSDRVRATPFRPRRIAAEPVPRRTLLARQDGEARAADWLERVLA